MSRQEVEHIILNFLKSYNMKRIGIFGSYARNENNQDSDIDILVKFKNTPSLLQLIKIENELSEKLGFKVDLITEGSLKNKKIKKFVKGIDKNEFAKNELIQDAVIRNFEIIGEASKKISTDLKQVYYEIPWKEISGMRDKLIHDYLGVEIEIIWKTIEQDLPTLQKELKKIE